MSSRTFGATLAAVVVAVLLPWLPPAASVVRAQADPCVEDVDCTGGGLCTAATCEGGECVFTPVPDGTVCGDPICVDTGDAHGGGVCTVKVWACNAGACETSASIYEDVCAGEDMLGLTTYQCSSIGIECVPTSTTENDACEDTGGAAGGGACSATNWYCVGGTTLASTGSSGFDACSGQDAVSLTTFACSAGDGSAADKCISTSTTESDACEDTGGAAGGGACSATDWYCVGGTTLASTASSGADVCSGADAVSLTTFACSAGDGSAADECVSTSTTNFDACADTGGALGGGACSATDWYCVAGTTLASTASSGTDACSGDDAIALTTFVCSTGDGGAADECVSTSATRYDACADTGDALGGGTCAAANWSCTGNAATVVSTDGTDVCSGTDEITVSSYACTSGDAGAVPDTCASHVETRDDLCNDTGDAFGGGTCAAADWSCAGNALSLVSTSGTDVCAGTPENPVVTSYACVTSGQGPVANTCASREETRSDACSDTGDALGGGTCAAADWSCAGNALSLVSTSGTDVCAGTPENPVVTSYACVTSGQGPVANTCASREETRSDACSDTGDALGGGTCAATDWSCVGGTTLASTGTSGTDVCGGTPESPNVTSYQCLNGNECRKAVNDCPAPIEQECGLAACAPDPGDPASGACTYGARPEFTPCGDPGKAACTGPDSCDANGACLPRNEPCGFVTSSELCSFDLDAMLPERQFRTIFTAAADVWPGYGIGATNPGQFFYNAIVQGAPGATTIAMDVPWPFVTQGATPVHVYDADAIDVLGEGSSFCFREDVDGSSVPPVNGTSYPAKITPELRAHGGFDPGDGLYAVECPAPAGAGAGDPCTVSITFEMPAAGQAYVNMRLDYGVKGALTDANPVDGAPDRYDVGITTCTGDARYRDAFVNTALRPSDPAYKLTPVGLATCAQYPFRHATDACPGPGDPACSGADSVQNVNVFKKPAVIAAEVTTDGGPWGRVLVSLWRAGRRLAAGRTDADGYFPFAYRHAGPAARYVLKVGAPANANARVELRGNRRATATYSYDTETQTGTWTGDWRRPSSR